MTAVGGNLPKVSWQEFSDQFAPKSGPKTFLTKSEQKSSKEVQSGLIDGIFAAGDEIRNQFA